MDVLRQINRESGWAAPEPKVPAFHEAFLNGIRKRGKVHELTMIERYNRTSGDLKEKLKTGAWKSELKLGMKLFIRGKLKFLPSRCGGFKEVRKLFEQAEEHRKQ
jgi:hypothetical protein